MEGRGLTFLALFCFAVGPLADKPVLGVVSGTVAGQRFVMEILFGCILGVTDYEFILSMAFETFNHVHHFPDSFNLHLIELFGPNEFFDLELGDVLPAVGGETGEDSSLVYEFLVDVFSDTAHAEKMPALFDVK